MTIYTHKENQSVKNYGEIQREFHQLRREDDEFARDYRSTELEMYIKDAYDVNPDIDISIPEHSSHLISIENNDNQKGYWPSIGKTSTSLLLSFSDEQIQQFATQENIVISSTSDEVMDAFKKGINLGIKINLQNG